MKWSEYVELISYHNFISY